MNRRPLIAGNWKMHTTVVEACHLAADIARQCEGISDRDVLLAPPFTVLSEIGHIVKDSAIILAGQNVCWEGQGAFTGEISPVMIRDTGGTAAIVGHSERRQIFGEDDELVNKRLKGAIRFDLMGILCVGETLAERESERTFAVVEQQIKGGLAGIDAARMTKVVIAYEPVWAIGTGKTATTDQAQEVHAFIRQCIDGIYEKSVADHLRILYGGSVKPGNIDALMEQEDIDGALVGGAALDAESFSRIIHFR